MLRTISSIFIFTAFVCTLLRSNGEANYEKQGLEKGTWIQQTANAPWSARSDLQLQRIPGTDSLLLFGGHANSDYYNDVWKSKNAGENWTQLPNAPWSPRSYHMSNVHDEYIYMLGGHNKTEWFNDVWRTKDGVEWELVVQNATWSPRAASAFQIRNGIFYVMGGSFGLLPPIGKGECKNDVWSSNDLGKTWTRLLENAPWPAREGLQKLTALYGNNDTILLTSGEAGYFGPYFDDVWSTTDGMVWTREDDALFSKRSGNLLVRSKGSIFTFGGYGFWKMKNDAYCLHGDDEQSGVFHDDSAQRRDTDNQWIELESCPWKGRFDYGMASLSDGTIVLLGGEASRFGAGGPYFSDVWVFVTPDCA